MQRIVHQILRWWIFVSFQSIICSQIPHLEQVNKKYEFLVLAIAIIATTLNKTGTLGHQE